MLTISFILAIIGLLIALYAFYIERKLARNSFYKPLCELSDRFSCTKPIKSEFNSLFGISNAQLGILFYAAMIVLLYIGLYKATLVFSAASLVASVIFAYILYTKIKTVCIVCTAIYLINILLFLTLIW